MASNKPLVDRTEAVYRQLRSLRRRFRVGGWLAMIVLGAILGYLLFALPLGYGWISEFRNPELIVSVVSQMADQQIPAVRRMAEDQVNQNASVWAEQASEQVLAQVAPMRKQIESLALQKSEEAIAKIDVLGEKKFRELLEQNRETVQTAIEQLKNDEDISEGAVIALQEAVEREFQIGADSQVDALVAIVSDINANMDQLASNEKLTREQKAERRVLTLMRRIHSDRFGDMTAEDIADAIPLDVVANYAEEQEAKELKKDLKKASAEVAEMAPVKDEAAEKPAAKPEEKAADKPKEEAKAEEKPAAKPEEKAKAEEKPAAKPEEKAKAEEKPAAKPEEKAKAEEKPAAKPEEKAKDAPAKEDKPAEKPEEKKDAS